MAENWNFASYVNAINEGGVTAKEALMDTGKRCPLTANLIARVMAGDTAAFTELVAAFPENYTLRKVEAILKGDVPETEKDIAKKEKRAEKKAARKAKKEAEPEEADEEEEEEEEAPKSKKSKKSRKSKKAEIEEEPETEADEDEDDDDWDL